MSTQPPISETEQAVLKVLWDLGRGTVREVLAALIEQGHSWAYTTVQTLLTRLMPRGTWPPTGPGRPTCTGRPSRGASCSSSGSSDLADTFCEGTASPLMLALVEGSEFTPEEIARFRRIARQARSRIRPRSEEGGQAVIDWLVTNALAALALAAIAGTSSGPSARPPRCATPSGWWSC